MRTRTRYISLSRALVRQHDWPVPTGSAKAFPRRVMALPLPGRLRSEVEPLLAVMRHLQQQLCGVHNPANAKGARSLSLM